MKKVRLPHRRPKLTMKARETWLKVATDLAGGMAAEDIAKRYVNPKTGKPYSRVWVYWVVNRLNHLKV